MEFEELMTWANGTHTVVTVEGTEVAILDRSERLANGVNATSRTVSEVLDLADEHDNLSRILRRAARRAYDNEQSKKG
jgi:hypothetical protein